MRWSLTLLLAAAAPAFADESLSIEHERYTLANGLEVVLAPDTSTPIVHTQLWYHVGSKDEQPGLTGFAHLFEHVMFQGSLNAPGEYFTPLQEVGGTLNGTTSTDRTNYFETVPSRYLPLALFMESDRMGHLLEVLDQAKLDNQREVVRNERRQRYENPPYGEAWLLLSSNLYPQGHPYHHATIGSHEDLENASLEDVKAFFRTWYVPNNATLVITGDFETDVAKRLVEENFGWIPAGPAPNHAEAAPVVLPENKDVRVYDEVPDRKVWLAWHSPAFYADGDAALDVTASILCGGRDSRLHAELVTRRRIARDVGCYQASRALGSNFIVAATAAEGHTTDEIAQVVLEQIQALGTTAPPTAEEVAAAVTDFEVGFYGRIQTIEGRAGMISSYLYYTGEADHLQEDLQRYLSLTPDQVRQWTADVLGAHHLQLHMLPAADQPAEEASR